MDDRTESLRHAAAAATRFLDGLADRPVWPDVDVASLRATLGGALPEAGASPADVIDALARDMDPGLVASAGPRYFGFVVGGSLPAAVAADWLVSAWDQNAGAFVMSPAAAVVEETAARWVLELLGLPAGAGVGFATGATMANASALAAARGAVLERVGWDAEARGLIGAPAIRIVIGEEAHTTIPYALRIVGLGAETAIRVPSDEQGRMRADALADVLRSGDGPTIVCAQAGNVNTGAIDPLGAIADASAAAGAWLHVDGAFGLWAAASPRTRHAMAGLERADSWTTDAHKWLNVPYDCGITIVADAARLQRTMSLTAAYLIGSEHGRDGYDWVPEASRRARAVPVYAAIRSLGRTGVADLVDRCSALARTFAARLREEPGVTILNEIALNQVLVRFDDSDEITRAVVAAVQHEGTMWAGGSTWRGMAAMRISVSNWSTTEADIEAAADAIIRTLRAVRSTG